MVAVLLRPSWIAGASSPYGHSDSDAAEASTAAQQTELGGSANVEAFRAMLAATHGREYRWLAIEGAARQARSGARDSALS